MKKSTYMLACGAALAAFHSAHAVAGEGYYGGIKGIFVPDQEVRSRRYNSGAGAGISFGNHLTPNIRAEADLAHTRADVKPNGAGSLRLTTAMANLYYDFPTGTAVTPYVGAGLGSVYGQATDDIHTDDDDFAFGYQLMAGASVEMQNGREFVAGYRFLDGQDLNVSGGRDFEMGSHNIEIGYRMPFSM